MRKVFVSSLGTKKHIECAYILNGKKSLLVSYIQEAFIDILCKNWNKNDLIIILCTKEAEKNNWKDRKDFGEGLESRLKQLSITPEVRMILIPDGKSEEETFETLNILLKEIKDGDKIFIDLTHAVRTLPLVQTMTAIYTGLTKNTEITGLYYGALDIFGTTERLKKMKPEERVIPILDLTPFVDKLDFTSTINCISQTKTFDHLKILIDRKNKFINITEESHQKPDEINSFLEKIEEIYLALLCAETRIITEKYPLKLNNEASILFKPLIQSLDFLLYNKAHENNHLLKGFESAKWCLNRNLPIQAMIFAIETTLIELCNLYDNGLKRDDWHNILTSIAENENNNNNRKKLLNQGCFFAQDIFKGIIYGKVKPGNRESTLKFLEKCREDAEFKCKYKNLTIEQKAIVRKYEDKLLPIARAYSRAVTLRNTLTSRGWEKGNNEETNPRELLNACKTEVDNLMKALKNLVKG